MQQVRLNRRRFLKLAGGTAGLLGLYTWRVEPVWLEVIHRPLPVQDLPSAWHHRRFVQLSDIHVGPRVDSDYLIAALRQVSELHPEFVVITGDFMSSNGTEQLDEVARVLGHLEPPRHGTLAVLGNHDYGPKWNRPDVASALVERLEYLGVTVLRNSACRFEGLTLIGMDDLWSGWFDLETVREELAGTGAKLVLCHNPDAADCPGWSGYRGWILSGHTHGGQCKPPFLPPPLLPVTNRRYTAGTFGLEDGRTLYINRGLGHLTRVRFNVRPEVTVFELIPA